MNVQTDSKYKSNKNYDFFLKYLAYLKNYYEALHMTCRRNKNIGIYIYIGYHGHKIRMFPQICVL